jgi:DNA-binding GntR family transcriptional regulator
MARAPRASYRLSPVVGPPTLGMTALEAIRASILRGSIGLGERLVEASLSKELGISRGPLREALALLEKEGLVENHPRKGRAVVQLTLRTLDEHYSLRKLLEMQAVGELIETLTPRKQRLLESCVKRMADAAGSEDPVRLALADLALHDMVYQLSDNDLLLKVWQENVAAKLRLLVNITGKTHLPMNTVGNHRQLVETIVGRDIAAAKHLVEDHVDDAWRRAADSLSALSEVG